MKLRLLEVKKFRGIKSLDWAIGGDCVCLVGPGDSTKSTILDAVEYVLSPRWNLPFNDSDFYDADLSEPFSICATVGDLPETWRSDEKFGLAVRGWNPKGELHDEPEDGDEVVLTIKLSVDESLEPTWTVINDRLPEGRPISTKDRERLGCTRLGDFFDRHLSWSRGSVLARLTGDVEHIGAVLAEAGRAARRALDTDQLPEKIQEVAKNTTTVGADYGVSPSTKYQALLDIQAASVGIGGLALHDGEVPVRRSGLGTRRLLTLGLQREAAKKGGIVLVDEVEHGLEPHRIRCLIKRLHDDHSGSCKHGGQVLMTTHSQIPLGELKASELRVVRSVKGQTTVTVVPTELQPIAIKASEAFLARKVIVCEGRTELGLCRGLNDWWAEQGKSLAYHGVALADGGGTSAPGMAVALASLGYPVLFLGDSDVDLKPTSNEMEAKGARVLLWDDGLAIEHRLARDLPWEGVAEMVGLAITEKGEESVRARVANILDVKPGVLPEEPNDWNQLECGEATVREAIGSAAKLSDKKRKGWFKMVALAEPLAALLRKYRTEIKETDTGKKVAELRKWVESDG